MGMQTRIGRNSQLIRNRNVVTEFVVEMADANSISVLLDRRIGFNLVNPGIVIAAKPSVRSNSCSDFDFAGGSAGNSHITRTCAHIEINRPVYGKRSLKPAFRKSAGRGL